MGNSAPKKTILQRLGLGMSKAKPVDASLSEQITPALAMSFGATSTSAASLMGSGKRSARARHQIYEKWGQMESDPIVSTALMLLCTAALGGHETTGGLVFIEPTAKAREDENLAELVATIAARLEPLFNRVAFQLAYTGSAFGDAYARVYADDSGVVDVYSDEMVRPMLVQPFEKGSRTVGYAVSVGDRQFERLDSIQMVRLKMPRTQWVPQPGVIEKSIRIALTEDDVDKVPLLPGMAGGSLLFNAEEAYDNLSQALAGLVGQRWIDSMDEQIMTLQMDNMTLEQQRRFSDAVKGMLMRSKQIADDAVREGRPVLERIRHIVPVFGEKQLTTMNAPNGSGRAASLGVEDVIFHARLLSGAIGVDLSMIGFADQLSGGLGDGGFFRVSAQAAERARVIRVALGECFDAILDIHCMKALGATFAAADRPWAVNFYGGISALEAERQRTRTDAMASVSSMGAAFQVFKDLGATPEMMQRIMSKEMKLDEEDATLLAGIFAGGVTAQDGGGFGGEDTPEPDDELSGDEIDDDPALDAVGDMEIIQIPAETVRWLGFDGAMSLRADLDALAARHAEYYDGAEDVLADIRFVLDKPDNWFVHSGKRIALFRERVGSGAAPLVRIDFDIFGKGIVARSVYACSKYSIAQKMNAKRREFERLGRSGHSYDSLAIADYLEMMGSGSSRPTPPSGGATKAMKW